MDGSARLRGARLTDGNMPGSAPRGSEERAWLKLEGAWGGPSSYGGFSQAAARHALMEAAFLLLPAPPCCFLKRSGKCQELGGRSPDNLASTYFFLCLLCSSLERFFCILSVNFT